MTRRRGSKTLLETRTAKLSDTRNVAILLFIDSSLLRNIQNLRVRSLPLITTNSEQETDHQSDLYNSQNRGLKFLEISGSVPKT
ncbi:hypothetical protein LINPERPRIM_LOCUS125 [Linum perenne]